MRVTDLIFTQGIQGFQAGKTVNSERPDGGREAHVSLVSAGIRCPGCGRGNGAVCGERERENAGLPVGRTRLVLHVTVHRIYCPGCGAAHYEQISFLPLASLGGITNKALQKALEGTECAKGMTGKRLSTRIGRNLRLLRDYGVISKVPEQRKSFLPEKGRTLTAVIPAIPSALTDQLTQQAA